MKRNKIVYLCPYRWDDKIIIRDGRKAMTMNGVVDRLYSNLNTLIKDLQKCVNREDRYLRSVQRHFNLNDQHRPSKFTVKIGKINREGARIEDQDGHLVMFARKIKIYK